MARIDVLFHAPDVQIGDFCCPPGDPLWRSENSIGSGWHVVFPGTGVLITQARGTIVANPNHAIFYDDGQSYRREILSDEGDQCVFLIASAGLVRDVYEELGEPERANAERPRFATASGPIDGDTYWLHRRVISHVRWGDPDALCVREAAYELLRRTLGAALGENRPGRGRRIGRRSATAAEHRRLVEETKRLLSRRFCDRLHLDDLAAELHVSPYHLARIFRDRTGWSVHHYLTDLRLRSSLARLSAARDLAGLAADLGFSSHAHFAVSFRRRFGVPPSAVRRIATARELVELRTITEAAPRPLT